MATVTGKVEAMSGKSAYGTYGMLINGKWYNSKWPIKANKGDEVEFDDGGKSYVNKLTVVSAGGGGGGAAPSATPTRSTSYSRGKFPIAKDDGQISIIRQNALTNAVKLVTEAKGLGANIEDSVSTILDIARVFEAYTSGDVDREAAKRMEFDPE